MYILIYGVHILNPLYIDWIFVEGSDLAQTYVGFKAFVSSKWYFPIGLMDTATYPYKKSIIFYDSVAIIDVLFKIFSPILPVDFQYIGMWGLLCFGLQGLMVSRILRKFSDNNVSILFASLAYVLMPAMLFRMHFHVPLAGHWVILYGIKQLLCYDKNDKKIFMKIALMAFWATSVHMYFVVMNGIILVGIIVYDWLSNKRIIKSMIMLADYLMVAFGIVALLGGFSVKKAEGVAGGFTANSFNLNGFINPFGWSFFIKDLPVYMEQQYEGLCYIGVGFLIFVIATMGVIISKKIQWKKK